MNKIILIGNGFDLTHGYKTSYKHFIDDFWESKANKFITAYLNEEKELKTKGTCNIYFQPDDEVISLFELKYTPKKIPKEILEKYGQEKMNSFLMFIGANANRNYKFTNQFLFQITSNLSLNKWVDIEIEYYKALIECSTGERSIVELNKEFILIKKELEKYLISEISRKRPPLQSINNLIDSFIINNSINNGIQATSSDKTLFLSFNYTNTEQQYVDELKNGTKKDVKCIHIHGEINKSDNPIIFGYDDNADEKQKSLLEKGNDFLQNIKSYYYNDNITQLQSFINSEKYEILIMGHSCGISDRTLLKLLFEHENCMNIKIYYYVDNNGNDDYTEKKMNITRILGEMSINTKIVPKSRCEPLSDISRLLPNPDGT
jgi:hypothetical protein